MIFNRAPFPALVVKASGLAAGKGVVVAASKEDACEAVDEILTEAKYGAAGSVVVIEELLEGDEVSVSKSLIIRPMCTAFFKRVANAYRKQLLTYVFLAIIVSYFLIHTTHS
jgi:hypothetical protein